MAVSGNQTKYNYNYGGYSAGAKPWSYLYLLCNYSEVVDNVNNKSTITVTVKLHHAEIYIGSRTVKVYWNGVQVGSFTADGISFPYSGEATSTLGTISFTVDHAQDGTASGVLKCEYYSSPLNYSGVNITEIGCCTDTIVLTAIPRTPPTISLVSISNTTYETAFHRRVAAGRSVSTIEITAASNTGGSIVEYGVSIGNIIVRSESNIISITVPEIEGNSQVIEYAVYVKDSSGLITTGVAEAFTAYKYIQGEFLSQPRSQRCQGDGTLDEDGTYAKCHIEFRHSTIGGEDINTKCIITINGDSGYSSSSPITKVLGNPLSLLMSYTVEYRLFDGVDSMSIYDEVSVAFHTWNVSPDGKGVAFGKLAVSGYFDVENMTVRLEGHTLLDLIFPVGCIYTSTVNTSPAGVLGGTWNPISLVSPYSWERIA